MKKLIWIIVIIVFLNKINMVFGSEEKTFCKCWEAGYKRGWCAEKVNCIFDTIVPICPIPEINLTTYKDGFDRGFKQSLKDRK